MVDWKIERAVDNGFETITITRPAGAVVKSSACVTRTYGGAYKLVCDIAYLSDDLQVVREKRTLTSDAKPLSQADAATMAKKLLPGVKVLAVAVEKSDTKIIGIPKDIFEAVGVEVERPASQCKAVE